MNFQTVSIKKLNSIFITKVGMNPNFVIDENIRLQLQMEAMKLGFIFTEDAILALAQNLRNYSDIFEVLNELVGANKVWKPFYTDFPNEVFEMSDRELYRNAITHYLTSGTWIVEAMPSKKIPTFEKVNFKKIGLCHESDIIQLFKDILSSNGSITDFDREVIVFAVKNGWLDGCIDVNIKFKETLCFFTGLLFTEGVKLDKYPSVKTATDVLRIATYFSKGDITLATKTIFKLKNSERKFIVKLLEPVIKAEEVAKFKSEWIALFHHLHIGTFTKSKNCNAVAHQLREEKVRTFNSQIEIAIKNKDNKALFKLLPLNMGDFGRRLDHIMRTVDASHVVTFFAPDNISKVDTRVLVQMLSHFRFRNEKMRIVMPKGVTKKAFILPQQDTMPQGILDIVTTNIELELKRRFTEKESLGKVYIAEELKKAPIPLQMRTASDGLYVMQRGTRLPLDKDKSVLRFFLHWIGNDVDLSACFLKEDLSYHSVISYYNLKNNGAYQSAHSGDITYAPAPNGACEFIDIDLDSIKDDAVRYIAMDVRVFSGNTFVNQEANAGWMMRDVVSASRGEIFDAKTVEQRIALSADRNAVVALFDVKEREVIWLDMEGQSSSLMGGNNVASNKASLKQIATMAVNFKNLSLYDLMKLHAESRGTVVENQEEADTVFDKNLIFNYTEVLSEYI